MTTISYVVDDKAEAIYEIIFPLVDHQAVTLEIPSWEIETGSAQFQYFDITLITCEIIRNTRIAHLTQYLSIYLIPVVQFSRSDIRLSKSWSHASYVTQETLVTILNE